MEQDKNKKVIFLNKPLLLNSLFALFVWGFWYAYTSPNSFQLINNHWPISLTMVFGSLIAGATSEGGGAIAFPIFTKILQIPPQEAKIFSLAIQSVGMTAATLTIVFMRITIEWRIILWTSFGGLFGITLGSMLIAPLLPASLLKMIFTAMIVSFAITLIILNWKRRIYNQNIPFVYWQEKSILFITGFFGGMMTGLVGTGIDIISFSVMILLFRLPEKIATPTSVILMAINAIVGFVLHAFIMDNFTLKVEEYWLAAIPVVVVGAPLGAYLCTRLSNQSIATLLISLIFIELTSSLYLIPLTYKMTMISTLVFVMFSFIYYHLSISNRYTQHLKK